MAMAFNQKQRGLIVSPVMVIAMVLSCYIVINAPDTTASWTIIFSMHQGLLPAMIVTFTGCTLFLKLSRLRLMQCLFGAAITVSDIGCKQFQEYFFNKPVSSESVWPVSSTRNMIKPKDDVSSI